MSLELEDHDWFPAWMRQHQMEFLSFMAMRFHLYQPVLPIIASLAKNKPVTEWTDCCSGAGGPVFYLFQHGFQPPIIFLADKYPFNPPPHYHVPGIKIMKVDVLQQAIPGSGLITIFNAFHHFSRQQQQQLLQQAFSQQRPILIAEIIRPALLDLLLVTIATTLGQILFAPFIKPFNWQRILFTYFIPVHIVTVTWDGWISVFRAISWKRWMQLVVATHSPGYSLSIELAGPWWRKVSILKGESNS